MPATARFRAPPTPPPNYPHPREAGVSHHEQPIDDVVFINGGVASVTTVMQDGTMIESATVGHEGMLGMEAFLGGDLAAGDTMMQVPDTSAEFLPVEIFKAELARRGPLSECVQRYSQGLVILMLQSTACMALHLYARRARW